MSKIPITSTPIISIAYRESESILTIKFSKGTYCYFSVPKQVFEGFNASKSKDAYFKEHIKESFPCHQLG